MLVSRMHPCRSEVSASLNTGFVAGHAESCASRSLWILDCGWAAPTSCMTRQKAGLASHTRLSHTLQRSDSDSRYVHRAEYDAVLRRPGRLLPGTVRGHCKICRSSRATAWA